MIQPVEVTYSDPSLFVAMDVYDTSSGSPVHVQQDAMGHVQNGTYVATFNRDPAKSYAIAIAVYTDGTFGTRDLEQPAASTKFDALPPPLSTGLVGLDFEMVVTPVDIDIVNP